MEILWTYSKRSRRKGTKKLLDPGSYSLHMIHGAFKSGVEKNGWYINWMFKTAYTILHDTPSRREDSISVTGEERFPLFFVQLAGWKMQLLQIDWLKFGKVWLRYWQDIGKGYRKASNLPWKVFLQETCSSLKETSCEYDLWTW